jgi:hypothetical protein
MTDPHATGSHAAKAANDILAGADAIPGDVLADGNPNVWRYGGVLDKPLRHGDTMTICRDGVKIHRRPWWRRLFRG